MAAQAPVKLEPGQLWLLPDADDPHPSRKPLRDFKSAIKQKLLEQNLTSEQFNNQMNENASNTHRGLIVNAEIAEYVKEALEKLREEYPNPQVIEAEKAQKRSAKPAVPEALAAGAVAVAALAARSEAPEPESPQEAAQAPAEETPGIRDAETRPIEPGEQVRKAASLPHDTKRGIRTARVHKPESEETAADGPAQGKLDKGVMMKGGAALGAVALGGVLLNKHKSRDKQDEPSRKQRLLKAVGTVLAVVIPVALLGRQVLERSQGAQR